VLTEPINYSEATQAANSPPIERDGGSFTAKARAGDRFRGQGISDSCASILLVHSWCTV